jgi:tetratricopeptide (TPR) repeat protein
MHKTWSFLLLLALTLPAVAAGGPEKSPAPKSPQAVRLYQEGMKLQENRRTFEALQKWREAVKLDPNLALAWAMLSTQETSPEAAREARDKARYLIENQPQSGADDLMIRWIVSRSETDLMYSIQAANDLSTKHADQKRILWAVGAWYGFTLRQYDRDVALQEAALKLDPNFAPSLDELGVAYAHLQRFDRAIEMVKRSAELTPNEPNPQSSLAEVLRLAGRFDDALEHYHQALKIMPSFDSAQLGLGDTYALMGDQKRAREEYAKCSSTGAVSTRLSCRKMAIYTYIREQNTDEASKQLRDFITQMHAVKRISFELEGLVTLGLITKDVDASLGYLDQALEAARASKTLPKSDRDEAIARTLAHKVRIATDAGKADVASKALAELEAIGAISKDSYVDSARHGGRGVALLAEKKYDEAYEELQDDLNDVYSEMILIRCFEKQGKRDASEVVRKMIMSRHSMDIDLSLVQRQLTGD